MLLVLTGTATAAAVWLIVVWRRHVDSDAGLAPLDPHQLDNVVRLQHERERARGGDA